MAKTSAFGFTNKTESTHDVTPYVLGLTSNYSLIQDAADVVKLNNKTAPIDQEELVAFRSRTVNNIASELNIQYPSPVKSGVEYSIRQEAVLSTTDSGDPSFRVDEPIVVTLAIKHPKSGNITAANVGEMVLRTISSCLRADGTWRFDDLMRSSERPIVD
jgi:hypothetical protein